MPSGPTSPVLRFIRSFAASGGAADSPDAQLLARFTAQGDDDAFAALVHRHGPMVLGVCRRLLHDPHDIEDAFQATFVVLVRKAGTLRRPERLASWLYGVACRTAAKARAGVARRHAHEQPLGELPAAVIPGDPAGEVRPVLDEELRRLPEKYRAPLVLCYLEGQTYAEA